MTLEIFWLFLGAVVLISCTPGPNVLYVTTRSIRFGFGSAMIGMSGCLSALTVILVASVAGVSAFMLAVPAAFDILKYAGAAYLIFLGIQTWRAPIEPALAAAASPRGTANRLALFRGGFLDGISKPKLLVFAPRRSSRNSSRRARLGRRNSRFWSRPSWRSTRASTSSTR